MKPEDLLFLLQSKSCVLDFLPIEEYNHGMLFEAYSDYENEERNKEINEFIESNSLDSGAFKEAISEYEFSEKFADDKIKNSLPAGLKFMERKSLTAKIKDFIKDNCEKYR